MLDVMRFSVEVEQEADGRWIAEIPQIPGAMAYRSTREEAVVPVYVATPPAGSIH